jgi:glutamine---fructose-6-phosphate transaminase (isomerizing)
MITDPTQTRMFTEAAEASGVIARQHRENAGAVQALVAVLKSLDPQILFTCARGSSDHAATFAKYLFETRLKLPTLSQAPSISSIYGGPLLHMKGQPFLLISQSGKSPDLLLSAQAAKKAGARVIALVNDTASPLAEMAEFVIPLHAGPETSVAATKSYIATLAALSQIAAAWTGDAELEAANAALPHQLAQAWDADWSRAGLFQEAQSLFVLGRGLTLGVAQEAALKFKETSGIHAEAFSAAEVAHGPMALVKSGFPLLVFPPHDKAVAGMEAIIEKFVARGAQIAVAGRSFAGTVELPLPSELHPVTAPIVMIQAFYRLINALSVARGFDPDHPPSLNKVTETR